MSRFVPVFCQSVSFHSTHMTFLFALFLAMIGCTVAVGTTPTMVGSPALMTTNGGTYPRSTRLSTGQLLGIYTHISGGTNTLVTCQSTDNGATWSDIGSVASGVGDIDNGFLLELPTTASGASHKRILAAFRNHSKDTAGNYTYYRITVCYSDDGGKTWKYLSEPEGKAPPNGIWEPFMRVAHDGNVQIYYARENSKTDQDIVQRVSKDGGVTWSQFNTVAGATTTGRDGMPGVTEFKTGSGNQLLTIFETTQDGPFHIKSVISTDDGATWGNRATVYVPTGTNNNAGSPQVATLGGNVMVAIFMTDEDTSQHNWIQGAGVKALTTSDGVNWGNKLSVSPPQSNWPGIIPLDDTHMLALFDHNGASSQSMQLS